MELPQEQLEAIASKIEKLLRLSKSPNEHEASAAAAKAQELLELYNLDMVLIERQAKSQGSAKREDTRLAGGLYKWQRDLWKETAELNFCKYWSIKGLEKGAKYEHRVLGRTTNVLSTRLLAEYLQDTVERITRAEYANDPRHYFSKAAIAYREGMVARITERLRTRRWEEKQKAKEQQTKDSTALTILDVETAESDANTDFINGWEPGTKARMRAESQAQYLRQMEEWKKMEAERKAEEEAFKRDHPEEWAKQQAERKKREERDAKRWANRKGRAYKGWEPRHAAFYDGYDKGKEVSLDKQIDKTERRRIG